MQEEEVEVTLSDVVGIEGMNTIKLMGRVNKQPMVILGHVNKQPMVILVDSGSTHNFLDPKVLNQLKITPEKTKPITVTVANGYKLMCDSMCCGFKWKVHNEIFEKDFRLLRLGGCDMVLGMDWVHNFSPIQLHTRPPGISFHKDGRKVLLKGLTKKVLLKQRSSRLFSASFSSRQGRRRIK